ncbi:MAG TPA: hypothetical protein VHA10_18045 [Hypericibacter adhaerens]|jgi:hypothetical protein|uniref:Uncharacterized protein n=1 Tax=Hypericibacter adhaerens TaxID=2602016 RepID=A0A5J6N4W2_9PROT|nr:hypothetical protein [Hypericibacter adhaerens]QEX24871.1 hypothetical protein FRZ61_48130 [Hypericibacter adhaerens]HWA45128.1 hypothetical protein [Hypericibacter adhaerens]
MSWFAALLAALFLAILIAMHRRHRARVKAERGALFAEALQVLDSYRIEQDDVDFPVLRGRYRGFEIRLEPVVDHVAVRKLPSLWLLATVKAELPQTATLDLLARPLNTEFYSPSGLMEHRLKAPPDCATDLRVSADRLEGLPSDGVVSRQVPLFQDSKMKELVMSPRGVRLVYQLAEAERPHYLVLRQAEFGEPPRLDPALLRRLLDRAIAIIADLRRDLLPAGEARPS